MVLITIKSGNDPQFLFDVPAKTEVEKVREQVRLIYNARLKVERIATEIDQLAQYGTILPENMQGLNEDQIIDLKLKDPWTEKCIPSGGAIENKDIYNRRNGQRPNDNMVKILQDTITKSKESISKKKIDEKVALTLEMVQESIDNMKGACMIVYPMVGFVCINKALFSFRDYRHTTQFKPNLKIAKISVGNKHQSW